MKIKNYGSIRALPWSQCHMTVLERTRSVTCLFSGTEVITCFACSLTKVFTGRFTLKFIATKFDAVFVKICQQKHLKCWILISKSNTLNLLMYRFKNYLKFQFRVMSHDTNYVSI